MGGEVRGGEGGRGLVGAFMTSDSQNLIYSSSILFVNPCTQHCMAIVSEIV